jgi:mono/diheme cytochrome c family protein
MDGAVLDLTLPFLVTTFVAATVAGLAGFAFRPVAAAGRLHAIPPLRTATVFIAFGLGVQAYSGTAGLAQDAAKARAGLEIWRSSGCVDCHGPFADGNRDDDDYPMGANLRTTRLDAAGIKLTISCGRPGTGMPSFDGGAYTVRACYGRPLGAAPDDLQPTPRTLSLDEIDALAAYLAARIVGHGKVTRAECLSYYEGKADCDDFK